jgi:steroid delta-isomerase
VAQEYHSATVSSLPARSECEVNWRVSLRVLRTSDWTALRAKTSNYGVPVSNSTLNAEHIRNVFVRYCEMMTAGDWEGVAALYTEDGSVEDPVGSTPHRGREAIRSFYRASAGSVVLELEGRPRVAGREGACGMRASPRGATVVIETLDTMVFADDGRIEEMRAYWSADTIVEPPE